jgi:hypothetical protein
MAPANSGAEWQSAAADGDADDDAIDACVGLCVCDDRAEAGGGGSEGIARLFAKRTDSWFAFEGNSKGRVKQAT